MAPRFRDGDVVFSVSYPNPNKLVPSCLMPAVQWQMDWVGTYYSRLHRLPWSFARRVLASFPQNRTKRVLRLSR